MHQPQALFPPATETPRVLAPPSFSCTRGDWGAGAAVVKVAGELDLAGAPLLIQELREASQSARLVVLDLCEVTFMDSAGVHAIVDASIQARSEGRQVLLTQVPERIQRVFRLTRTCDRLDVFDAGAWEPPTEAHFPLSGEGIAGA